jgi:acetyl-CoA synthetase
MSQSKVYPVSSEVESRALITNDQYLKMYAASIERPEDFWTQQANEFLTWYKPWDKVTESNFSRGEV